MNFPHYILAGRFIDGLSEEVHRNVYLKIVDGIISEIVSVSALAKRPALAESAVTDLSAHCIAPALIDCSVDLLRSSALDSRNWLCGKAENENVRTLLYKNTGYYRNSAVLAVINTSEMGSLLQDYQKRTPPHRQIVIQNVGEGNVLPASPAPDWRRMYWSHNIDDIDAVPLPDFSRKPEIDLTHPGIQPGIQLIGVANTDNGVQKALQAGCCVIEQGYAMGKDTLRQLTDKGLLWVPSLLRAKNQLDQSGPESAIGCRFSQRVATQGQASPEQEDFWKATLDNHLELVRFAREIGTRIAVGSGAGQPGILHGESTAEEMKLLKKAGYSLPEVFRAASSTPAEFFGLSQRCGLQVGQQATFLATRGSVSQMLRKLSFLEKIFVNGSTDDG